MGVKTQAAGGDSGGGGSSGGTGGCGIGGGGSGNDDSDWVRGGGFAALETHTPSVVSRPGTVGGRRQAAVGVAGEDAAAGGCGSG